MYVYIVIFIEYEMYLGRKAQIESIYLSDPLIEQHRSILPAFHCLRVGYVESKCKQDKDARVRILVLCSVCATISVQIFVTLTR